MLSTLPRHVLAAGGRVLGPLGFHKTKGNAVEAHWLPSTVGDFALSLQEDFGKKILRLLCHVPPGLPLPPKGSSLVFSHNV